MVKNEGLVSLWNGLPPALARGERTAGTRARCPPPLITPQQRVKVRAPPLITPQHHHQASFMAE